MNRAEISAFLSELQSINLQLRSQLEFAEHLIPKLNQQIAQLGAIQLLGRFTIRGEIIYDRCYTDNEVGSDGLVLQAALLVPEGFGAIAWDREEYLVHLRNERIEHHRLQSLFTPFADLASGQKAVLLSVLPGLLKELHLAIHSAGASK